VGGRELAVVTTSEPDSKCEASSSISSKGQGEITDIDGEREKLRAKQAKRRTRNREVARKLANSST
jgi:hypothetical protein